MPIVEEYINPPLINGWSDDEVANVWPFVILAVLRFPAGSLKLCWGEEDQTFFDQV